MGIELAHEGGTFINFRHYPFPTPAAHGYRWVDAKHLRLRASAESGPDRALVAAVIGHEQFRDDYAGGGVDPEGVRHGPYWLRSITPDAYETVTAARGVQILRQWLGPDEEIPAQLAADLRRDVFAAISTADRVHCLRELGDDALHDWGGVHGEFHEFLLVDRRVARITLLVAADD